MWFTSIKSKIITLLDYQLKAKYSTTYPNLTVTDRGQNPTDAVFPCVYVNELMGSELAKTLETGVVDAVQSDLQIEVYSDISQTEADYVAGTVMEIMVGLGYSIIVKPYPMNANGVYRIVARYRRTIGSEDNIF